jgi:hypothetical protein
LKTGRWRRRSSPPSSCGAAVFCSRFSVDPYLERIRALEEELRKEREARELAETAAHRLAILTAEHERLATQLVHPLLTWPHRGSSSSKLLSEQRGLGKKAKVAFGLSCRGRSKSLRDVKYRWSVKLKFVAWRRPRMVISLRVSLVCQRMMAASLLWLHGSRHGSFFYLWQQMSPWNDE